MGNHPELTFGQRIEHMRRRRGLSRKTLASLLGYSDEWLRQVERKGRPVERVSTLLLLAQILQVKDVSTLIGTTIPRQRTGEQADLVMTGVREALLRCRLRVGRTGDLPVLRRQELDAAWTLWRTSEHRYSTIRRRLPKLLDRVGDLDDHFVRADTFRLVSSFLLRIGDFHFSQVAVDYALAELATRRDSLAWYANVGQFSEILLRSGSHHESRKLAMETAAEMTRLPAGPSGKHHATLAALHLVAAESAAAMKDHRSAQISLDRAREIVSTMGREVLDPMCRFSMTNVDVKAVRVELTLGRFTQALRLADQLDGLDRLSREAQSTHYLTLARTHLANNDLIATTFALMQAERICTEEIQFDHDARRIITSALAHNNSSVRFELSELAERAGIL